LCGCPATADTAGNSPERPSAYDDPKVNGPTARSDRRSISSRAAGVPGISCGEEYCGDHVGRKQNGGRAAAELVKLCKGTQKAWADGRSFMLVMKDPVAPDMRTPVQKLLEWRLRI
jgi:hypothetical protein